MFTFLHAADVHLDSPLRGLERYDGAPVDHIRGACRKALKNLVQLALDEKVDFVLLAGDLYDGDWRDFNTGLFLVGQMARLKDAGIRVFTLAGNHDAANKMTRSLTLPDNVKVLSSKRPETFSLDDFDVRIHGQGFATEAVWHDLSQNYPAATKNCFNIGLLHTCADCSGHERYAPCTIDGLRMKEYNYWALGHIHKRQVRNHEPHIVFPGNVQGRHIGEDDEHGPKGCYLVTVGDKQAPELKFHALDVVRWHRCVITAKSEESPDAILDRVIAELGVLRRDTEPSLWAVRVEVRGKCKAHAALQAKSAHWISELRARALALDAERIWLEKIMFKTAPAAETSTQTLDGPLEELVAVLGELGRDPKELTQLGEQLTDLKRKLPAELTQSDEGLDPTDPAWLRGLLDQVEPVLRERLLASDKAP
jgi:DNA repair exonuclease SbcCD nuclease subunit